MTLDLFDLLCSLKKVVVAWFETSDLVATIDNLFWNILQMEKELKPEMLAELYLNFIKCLNQENSNSFI